MSNLLYAIWEILKWIKIPLLITAGAGIIIGVIKKFTN